MNIPLSITAHNVSLPASVDELIRGLAAKLDKVHPHLNSCRVVIEAPGARHRTGAAYEVHIDLTVPGSELVVNRQAADDLVVAVHGAFKAARRQLENHASKLRGEVKSHDTTPTGRIVRLFPDEGYGFIGTAEGREIYFHRNSVHKPGFEHLEVGTPVRFAEEQGDDGIHASAVVPH